VQLADLNQTVDVPPASLQAFMARVKIVAEEDLLAGYPATWPAQIVVTTSQARHERRVDHIPGDPARPFTAAEFARKFEHFVAPVAGRDSAALLRSALAALNSRDALDALKQELDRIMARSAECGRPGYGAPA
jgi:2-methylcitrate dehydratase PrpD